MALSVEKDDNILLLKSHTRDAIDFLSALIIQIASRRIRH